MPNDLSPLDFIVRQYEPIVRASHPDQADHWPVVSGANTKNGGYKDWLIVFLQHTGNRGSTSFTGVGEIPRSAIGFEDINDANIEQVRTNLLRHFRACPDDAVVLVGPSKRLDPRELTAMLRRHETALGLARTKIFLSHKSPDKARVRDFKATLDALGFVAWLDEDAMAAGAMLDRAILKGMEDSCAAVFFLTPNFADEAYLAAEINYAIDQQRQRPEEFAIIALVLEESGKRPPVPGLLRPFVWKEPTTELTALREILRALPIKLGAPHWR